LPLLDRLGFPWYIGEVNEGRNELGLRLRVVDRRGKRAKGIEHRLRGGLFVLGVLALLAALLIPWRGSLLAFFARGERIRGFVTRFGPWAPAAIVLLHVAQVLLAPIPGQAVDAASGYLLGALWGTFYSLVGVTVGSAMAMALARRFGRPLVERWVKPQTLERLDRYSQERGVLFLFLVFLFPFLPDDAACFLAGLTPLPLPELIVLAALGRLPGLLIANLMGASASRLTPAQGAAFLGALMAIALAFWRYQARVERAMLSSIAWLTKKVKSQ